MTSKKEINEVKETHSWAYKFFVDDVIARSKKEMEIIDSFHELYRLYPKYYIISEIFEEANDESIKTWALKIQGTVKAFLAGGAGVFASELSGLNINTLSFWGTLAVIAGGSEALYHINKKDLNLHYTKKEKELIFEEFKTRCDEFEEALNNYSYKVQEYVVEFDNKEKTDWLLNFWRILNRHIDYIEEKKEKGDFNEKFDEVSGIKFHDRIFDINEFNRVLEKVKEINKEDEEKTRKRD